VEFCVINCRREGRARCGGYTRWTRAERWQRATGRLEALHCSSSHEEHWYLQKWPSSLCI